MAEDKVSNFYFLESIFDKLYAAAGQAENHVFTAPRTSAFYCRYCLERTVNWIYTLDSYVKKPYQNTLSAMIHERTFKNNLGGGLFTGLKYIVKLGNNAVHTESKLSHREALMSVRHLFYFLKWFFTCYGQVKMKIDDFDDTIIPRTGPADKSSKELKKKQEELEKKDALIEEKEKALISSQEQIEALQAEIQRIKEANRPQIIDLPPVDEITEKETRELYIDLLLREVGWEPNGKNVREYEVTGMPNTKGIGYADYVLWDDNGLPLAVIEAKRTMIDPREGQEQVRLYADCLEEMTGQRPVIYYTNGYDTYMWDDVFYPPREVQGFYKKDELRLLIHRRETRKDIREAKPNKNIIDRYYQERALRRVAEAFAHKQREALLVLATGTGKTRTAIAIVEMLMKANWIKRVLFLADRTALVKQAKNAFKAHMPQASLVNLCEDKNDTTSRIAFSTYPTIMNLIDEKRKKDVKQFGIGHFDLIIIDEAHRSIYVKYRAIFEYFDSLLLGLTATPKDEIDRNTYHLFNLEDHNPTDAYQLEEAVRDGFLTPPKAFDVPLKFQREGIKYHELSDEEKEEYEMEFRNGETGEMPEEIGSSALNNWLFNTDTVDKVLGCLMEQGLKIEGGDKLGKTIIFAKSHKHAEFIKKRFDMNFPDLKGKFARVVDNHVKYAQSLIDKFSIAKKEPFIAISVDMLDTGIDVPEILNLVFFKTVKSRAKFWQMIGRGTRLCPDLFAQGEDKEYFCIFDFCSNFEFFDQNPEGLKSKRQESLGQKIFNRRLSISRYLEMSEFQKDEGHRKYREFLLDVLHSDVASLDTDTVLVRPHRKYVDRFAKRKRWDILTETDVIDIHEHLSHLSSHTDEDESARRFDLFMLSFQLDFCEKLRPDSKFFGEVLRIAESLQKKANIPMVAEKMDFIKKVQTVEFLEGLNLLDLEDVRENLRELIRFLDKDDGQPDVYTRFEDNLGEAAEIERALGSDVTLVNYRKRVEKFVRDHESHVTIHKLKTNRPITETDLEELERILFSSEDSPGEREDYERIYGNERPLGAFIRSIVGLDRNAAKEAFGKFMEPAAFTGNQITFINQIIDYLTVNGVMEPGILFEQPPFTDRHNEGITGVFPEEAALRVIETIRTINRNADIA